MKKFLLGCALAAAIPATAFAQPQAISPAMNGVRLDVVAAGRVARAPDQVTLSAGVTTRADRAEAALAENAQRMTRVRAALERAGIAARDIQTGHVGLSQDYRPDPANNNEMRPSGYVATNNVNIRFRDIARAGRIIDALVAEGANNVNGPSFGIADREPAMDEARTRAITAARARAELYARALGTRVLRIVAISEVTSGGPIMLQSANFARAEAADTRIEPGEVEIEANVMVTFELERPAN
jgi:uncharacterized protein YggE